MANLEISEKNKIQSTHATREYFKIKLKAMRCRFKKRNENFKKMGAVAINTSILEKKYSLFNQKVESIDDNKQIQQDSDDSISIEMTLEQNNIWEKISTNSRTSTPIFFERKKSNKKRKFSFNTIESSVAVKKKKTINAYLEIGNIHKPKSSKKYINTQKHKESKANGKHNLYNNYTLFNSYDYHFHVDNINSCCNSNLFESIIQMPPNEFQEFGDFKVWYI